MSFCLQRQPERDFLQGSADYFLLSDGISGARNSIHCCGMVIFTVPDVTFSYFSAQQPCSRTCRRLPVAKSR
jgi:hypothetical protein